MKSRIHRRGWTEPVLPDGSSGPTISYGSDLSAHVTQADRLDESTRVRLGLENKNQSLTVRVLVNAQIIGIATSVGAYDWKIDNSGLYKEASLNGDDARRFMDKMRKQASVRVSVRSGQETINSHFSGRDMCSTPVQWILDRKRDITFSESARILRTGGMNSAINMLGRVLPLLTWAIAALAVGLDKLARKKIAQLTAGAVFLLFALAWVTLEFASFPMAIAQMSGVSLGTTSLIGQIVSFVMFPFSIFAIVKAMQRVGNGRSNEDLSA